MKDAVTLVFVVFFVIEFGCRFGERTRLRFGSFLGGAVVSESLRPRNPLRCQQRVLSGHQLGLKNHGRAIGDTRERDRPVPARVAGKGRGEQQGQDVVVLDNVPGRFADRRRRRDLQECIASNVNRGEKRLVCDGRGLWCFRLCQLGLDGFGCHCGFAVNGTDGIRRRDSIRCLGVLRGLDLLSFRNLRRLALRAVDRRSVGHGFRLGNGSDGIRRGHLNC